MVKYLKISGEKFAARRNALFLRQKDVADKAGFGQKLSESQGGIEVWEFTMAIPDKGRAPTESKYIVTFTNQIATKIYVPNPQLAK